jgi:simple sugar transport system permease protein
VKYKLEKRLVQSPWLQALAIFIGLATALGVSSLLIISAGANVGEALSAIYNGSFGDWDSIAETLVQATPLIFCGMAIVIAFRARVWNIGAEGQFFAGAMVAILVGMTLSGLPRPLLLFAIILGAMVGGSIWGGIPGFLKARFNANEIITTVMMNYIIMFFLSYLLSSVWREPGHFFLQTARLPEVSHLPVVASGTRLHLGFILSLISGVFAYLLLWKTPLGYEIRAVGFNPVAAQYKGISIKRTIVLTMIISGAIAGLAGGCEVVGLHFRLRLDISTGYGYTGIIIALLGRLHPVGVIISAIFFGALVNGSTSMQIITGVPVALVYCVEAIVLIFVLSADIISRYRIRRIRDVE